MAAPLLTWLGPLPRAPLTEAPSRVRCCTVNATSLCTRKMRVVPPPLSVTRPLPSMTVSFAIVFGVVTTSVVGAVPQLKTTTPPAPIAAASAASLHEEGLPEPTTVVGLDTSAAIAGGMHAFGTGGGAMPVLEELAAHDPPLPELPWPE